MGRIRGILLVGLSGFELGLILCRLYDLSPLFSLIFALAGFLGAVAGSFSGSNQLWRHSFSGSAPD